MSLLWHSAVLLGIDAARLFTSIGAVLNGRGGQQLTSFAQRSPEHQSIEAMGYIEDTDKAGLRYRRTW